MNAFQDHNLRDKAAAYLFLVELAEGWLLKETLAVLVVGWVVAELELLAGALVCN